MGLGFGGLGGRGRELGDVAGEFALECQNRARSLLNRCLADDFGPVVRAQLEIEVQQARRQEHRATAERTADEVAPSGEGAQLLDQETAHTVRALRCYRQRAWLVGGRER